jgi:aminodeoxyfutalosine deaminase
MQSATVVALAKNYGDRLDEATVVTRYSSRDFAGFIEAYKWVTSYLRAPADYAFVARRMCEQMLTQNVVYAEVTLSIGVMILRKQDVAANFRAVCEAVEPYVARGLRLQWIFDAVRQFGAAAAREVAHYAVEMRNCGVIAFGMGGDELAIPAAEFRDVYDYAAANGLHRLVHAGEIGEAGSVREAVEILGAERIGHGISAANDAQLMSLLAERSIHLEICPTSNLRTGALARCLSRTGVTISDHPLPELVRAGIPISISTDDPAMFNANLASEFDSLKQMGLERQEILKIAQTAFLGAFLPESDKSALLQSFGSKAAALSLL